MTHPTPDLATASPNSVRSSSFVRNRWVQLSAGILGMVAVANFQYAWTLFEKPLERRHGWTRVEILDALHVYFVLAQTWLVPLEGYLAERFGPRRLRSEERRVGGGGW